MKPSFMKKRGFTLAELMISIAVLGIVLGVTVGAFSNYKKTGSVDKNAAKIIALLEEARSDTLASKNEKQYGVHFDSDKAVFFEGTAYMAGASTNKVVGMDANTSISTNLYASSSNVIFDRLTGTTIGFGTTTVTANGLSNLIVIYRSGLVELK